MRAATDLEQRFAAAAREARAAASALEARRSELAARATRLAAELEKDKADREAVARELEALRMEESAIPARVAELTRLAAEEEARADREGRAADAASAGARSQLDQLQRQLGALEDALGLSIEQVPEQGLVRLRFVRLDPADPARPFVFGLRTAADGAETGTYVVVDCSPAVPELPTALEELNRHPDQFFAFVRTMRRAFRRGLGLG